MEEWNEKLLPECTPKRTYEIIKDFWSQFGRKPKDYFHDMEIQWDGLVKNGQRVWISDDKFIPHVSVREVKGLRSGIFIHRWNNMCSVVLDSGEDICSSMGGTLFKT